MIIGIDGNEANQENLVGVGQVAFNVIYQLSRIDKNNSYQIYLKDSPKNGMPVYGEKWKYSVFGPKKGWTQIALPFKLFFQKQKPKIFFSPSHYAPRFTSIPTVIYLMDMWHHRHPEQFAKKDLYQLTKWEKYSVKNASHILTISEFSKREILDIYKLPEDKVTVVYPGFTNFQFTISNFQSNLNDKISNVKNKYGIKGEYFLYIGTLQPKKNIEGLIKAFKQIADRYLVLGDRTKIIKNNTNTQPLSPITLVVAGKKGWMYEKIFELVKELKLEDKVIFTGFITEEEKPYLMAGAKAFVFPSFYEGFGIPVLESMSLGVPVIISKEGSLPEIGDNAAIYCDPYDTGSIRAAMEKVLNLKQEERNEIIMKGLKQCEKFSWEKCGKKVLEVLEKVSVNSELQTPCHRERMK